MYITMRFTVIKKMVFDKYCKDKEFI